MHVKTVVLPILLLIGAIGCTTDETPAQPLSTSVNTLSAAAMGSHTLAPTRTITPTRPPPALSIATPRALPSPSTTIDSAAPTVTSSTLPRLVVRISTQVIPAGSGTTGEIDACMLITPNETQELLGALDGTPIESADLGPSVRGGCQWTMLPAEGKFLGDNLAVTVFLPLLVPPDTYYQELTAPFATLNPVPVEGMGDAAIYIGDEERTSQMFVLADNLVLYFFASGVEKSKLETFAKLFLERMPY